MQATGYGWMDGYIERVTVIMHRRPAGGLIAMKVPTVASMLSKSSRCTQNMEIQQLTTTVRHELAPGQKKTYFATITNNW